MTAGSGHRERQARWWDLAASCLLLEAPMVTHLVYHGVPLGSADAVGLMAGPLVAGLLLGWVAGQVRSWLRTLIFGALTLAFLDVTLPPEFIRFRFVIPAAFFAAWVLRAHYAKLATVTTAAAMAALALPHTTLKVQSWSAAPANQSPVDSLVPILHVVLDEHAAPKAFPSDIPEAARARDRVRAFYSTHGFRLYENAYSQYFWTQTAVPASLDETDGGRPGRSAVLRNGKVFLVRSSVLDWAQRQGYRIRVIQNDYLDVCGTLRASITSCRSYPAVSLESLRLAELDLPHRLLLEYAHFVSTRSHIVRAVVSRLRRRAWDRASPADAGTSLPHWALDEPHVMTARRELRTLRTTIRRDLPGSLIFAHVILPHSPYEVDEHCRAYRWPSGYLRRWSGADRSNTPAARRLRWSLYARQVECLYSELDSLVAAVTSAAPPQGVLVVLQGDHGSRIVAHHPRVVPGKVVADQDILDGFATLLAVRGPGIVAGVDSHPVAVQALVPRLITGAVSLDSLPASPPVVYLDRAGPRPGVTSHRAPVLGRAKDDP